MWLSQHDGFTAVDPSAV